MLMNIMVLFTSTRSGILCASFNNSFPYDLPHSSQYFGIFIRCRISINYPASSLNTVLRICIGNFLMVILSGMTFSCAVSINSNIYSWVDHRKRVFIIVLNTGACRASIMLLIVSPNLENTSSSAYENSAAVNLGNRQGGTTLGGGWVFMLLDGCCIGSSTLGGGLVSLINGGAG